MKQKSKLLSTVVEKVDDLDYDLGNLLASDIHAVDDAAFNAEGEAYLKTRSRENMQLLIGRLFSLPTRPLEDEPGRLVGLPDPAALIPREKPLPKQKEKSRWQVFAEEKGIRKQKRSRLLWDEEHQDWKPRHGMNRANDEMRDWAIPASSKDVPGSDPWEQRAKEKKERIQENKDKHLKNVARAQKLGKKEARLPGTLNMTVKNYSGKRAEDKAGKNIKGASKGELLSAYALAKSATASMGKFDKAVDKSIEPKLKTAGKKRKFEPVASANTSKKEGSKALKIVDKLLKKRDKDSIATAKHRMAAVAQQVGENKAHKKAVEKAQKGPKKARK